MVRRAAFAAFALLILSTVNVSAATKTVDIVNYAFMPASTTIGVGGKVSWHNTTTTTTHTTTADLFGLWSKTVSPGATQSVTFISSGNFTFHCAIHPFMTGKIAVKPIASPTSGSTATTFTIRVLSGLIRSSFTEDIQKRKAGGSFQTWQSTTNQTVTFQPAKGGTYEFRTRLRRKSDGLATGWSPVVSIQVL